MASAGLFGTSHINPSTLVLPADFTRVIKFNFWMRIEIEPYLIMKLSVN